MDRFPHLVEGLADQGWAVAEGFLAPEAVAALAAEVRQLRDAGAFRQAGVGRGAEHGVRSEVRGDQILWLSEETLTPAQVPYWSAMEALRQELNRELFLGLASFEAHYAVYPPGAFYRKHLDRFAKSDERTISSVFYLNEGWSEEKGGQLRLYLPQGPEGHRDVVPRAGIFAAFRSDSVYHEVLPATDFRFSITAWFRRRSLL
ncbi:MAG TPA: 2OG-Fe(II) oxygenase [Thermoanaerobaculia bacterium]